MKKKCSDEITGKQFFFCSRIDDGPTIVRQWSNTIMTLPPPPNTAQGSAQCSPQ